MRVARLTARGVFGIREWGLQGFVTVVEFPASAAFHFTAPSTRRGLNGIIPTASQALMILLGVKANRLAGINILWNTNKYV